MDRNGKRKQDSIKRESPIFQLCLTSPDNGTFISPESIVCKRIVNGCSRDIRGWSQEKKWFMSFPLFPGKALLSASWHYIRNYIQVIVNWFFYLMRESGKRRHKVSEWKETRAIFAGIFCQMLNWKKKFWAHLTIILGKRNIFDHLPQFLWKIKQIALYFLSVNLLWVSFTQREITPGELLNAFGSKKDQFLPSLAFCHSPSSFCEEKKKTDKKEERNWKMTRLLQMENDGFACGFSETWMKLLYRQPA